MDIQQYIKKFIIFAIPALIGLGVLFGLYQWQFNPDTLTNQDIYQDDLYQQSGNNTFEDYYNTARGLSPVENNTTETTFNAVGDIMLSRTVATKIAQNNYDANWPFANITDTLLAVDFNVGNLESPFSSSDVYAAQDSNNGGINFNAPSWTWPGLQTHNFTVLSTANNHSLDQGLDGILATKKTITDNQSVAVGTGSTKEEAWTGQVYTSQGIDIGFLAASYGFGSAQTTVARIQETQQLTNAIAELKTRSDFVIVFMHAGTEYVRSSNQQQTSFARAAIDAGADMVIGSHPHWIQTIEEYKDKYIFYSLGNFVFDQMWSQDTREGLMLNITLEKTGSCGPNPGLSTAQSQISCSSELQGSRLPATVKQVKLLPVVIENFGQPRLASPEESQTILKKIGETSDLLVAP